MKIIAKIGSGLALSALVIGQPVLAASPRAMNSQATGSSAGKVEGVRMSGGVARKNNAGASGTTLVVGALALAAAGAGVYFLVDDKKDDAPASP